VGLSTWKLSTLHHGRILLLEAFSEASRALEILVDTPKDTALLAGDQGLGGEVVDAVVEATLDEPGVHRHKFLHLLLLNAGRKLTLFRCR